MIIKFACDITGTIGYEGGIPWKCREDMRDFKRATEGNVVLMGRKTWESIGEKPLPKRINVVVSRDEKWVSEMNRKFVDTSHLLFVCGLGNAIRTAELLASSYDCEKCKIYAIGGAEIIRAILRDYAEMVERIEKSVIRCICVGDTVIDPELFNNFQDKIVIKEYEPDD